MLIDFLTELRLQESEDNSLWWNTIEPSVHVPLDLEQLLMHLNELNIFYEPAWN